MKSNIGKRKVYFSLQFQEDRVHYCREDMATGREGTVELADHIFIHTQEAQRENRKCSTPIKPQSLPPSDGLPPAKFYLQQVLESSQITPATGEQLSKYTSLREILLLKPHASSAPNRLMASS